MAIAHQPIRTCIGCRARDARAAMLRVVARNGELRLDREKRLEGRGAYLHARQVCVDAFARRGGFVRSLKCVVAKGQRESFRARFPEVQA